MKHAEIENQIAELLQKHYFCCEGKHHIVLNNSKILLRHGTEHREGDILILNLGNTRPNLGLTTAEWNRCTQKISLLLQGQKKCQANQKHLTNPAVQNC